MLSITPDIRSALLQSAEIQRICGTRVFPITAPKGTEGAFITIDRESYSMDFCKMSTYNESAVLGIYALSPDYDESLEMAEAIRNVVKNTKVNGIGMKITDAKEDLTNQEINGQMWYAQVFFVECGNLNIQ